MKTMKSEHDLERIGKLDTSEKVKLHLGCYHKKIAGFVNIDIREDINPDVVDDVFKLEKYEKNSVDLIYICHVLEHATRAEAHQALIRYHEVLKEEGVLRVSVPDMQAVMEHYVYHKDIRLLKTFFHGSQLHDYDFHRAGWDFRTLSEDLLDVGFRTALRYDWRETEHFYVDDYSQAYLPHMDKTNGRLMSLNVEAIK